MCSKFNVDDIIFFYNIKTGNVQQGIIIEISQPYVGYEPPTDYEYLVLYAKRKVRLSEDEIFLDKESVKAHFTQIIQADILYSKQKIAENKQRIKAQLKRIRGLKKVKYLYLK